MQQHDLSLAAEMTKLEQTDDHGLQESKFKLINGILYYMSPAKQFVLCVPPIVAESIAIQLHHSNLFHFPANSCLTFKLNFFIPKV